MRKLIAQTVADSVPAKVEEFVAVNFGGASIGVIQKDGRRWVSIRALCRELGISNQSQQDKLKADTSIMRKDILTHDSMGRPTKLFCIVAEQIVGWLYTIRPMKITPKARAKLQVYKSQLFDAIVKACADRANQPLAEARQAYLESAERQDKVIRHQIRTTVAVEKLAGRTLEVTDSGKEFARRCRQAQDAKREAEEAAEFVLEANYGDEFDKNIPTTLLGLKLPYNSTMIAAELGVSAKHFVKKIVGWGIMQRRPMTQLANYASIWPTAAYVNILGSTPWDVLGAAVTRKGQHPNTLRKESDHPVWRWSERGAKWITAEWVRRTASEAADTARAGGITTDLF